MLRHLTTALAGTIAAVVVPLAAAAYDAGLVLGIEDYEQLGRLPRGDDVRDALGGLEALGFDLTAEFDTSAAEAADALSRLMDKVPRAERLVVALSGRFVTDGDRTWYMTADARPPKLFALDESAVSVESVMAVLARSPSRAVLLLGVDPRAEAAFDPWLREGLGNLDVPQGVTVLIGTPLDAADFLRNELGVAGGDLSRLVTENGAIRAQGYLPRGFVFAPAAPQPQPDPAAEDALWQGALALDTVEAYRNYLGAYPGGRFAAEAEGAINAILTEPFRRERMAEESLRLSLDQRSAIQRDLLRLDFDPRGVDGIFGPGTRGAVVNWQQQNGFAQTGYLTPEQIARIEAQAAQREAQVAAEDEQRRQAALAAERGFWEESGARGDEGGLRAYLERYPGGLYADEAAQRLALIEDERRRAGEEAARAAAEAEDRQAWEAAREADTARAYRRYLEAFPQGRFAEEARVRRQSIVEDDAAEGGNDARAAARAAEDALGLNALTARVIEQRLEALGLDPGAVDGTFDRDTRRALRTFQRDRDLPVSGFLNEPTLVRLLSDTLGRGLED